MVTPPPWLADFSDQCALLIEGYDILAPIGCHYHFNHQQEEWEVTLFSSYTEVIGKEWDGQLTLSRFSINVLKLVSLFEEVHSCCWQSHKLDANDDLGQHLSILGDYLGHSIWLRILAKPPSESEIGRVFDSHRSQLEDLW